MLLDVICVFVANGFDFFHLAFSSFPLNIVDFSESLFVLVLLLFLEDLLDIFLEFEDSFKFNGSKIFFCHVFDLDSFNFGDLISFDLDNFSSYFHFLLKELSVDLFSKFLFF